MSAVLSPREQADRIALAVVKSRSIAAERSAQTLEDCEALWPRFYGTTDPLAILNAYERMTANGREPSVHDTYNLLSLAWLEVNRDLFTVAYFLRWQEDPPTPMHYMRNAVRNEVPS